MVAYTDAPDPFGQALGMRVDGITVRLTAGPGHLSPAGKVHGGVIAALLDTACGAAVCATLGPHDRCSTVEIKVNYFHPVSAGDELEAVAKVAFRGRKLCALVATLTRGGADEPVAMATATFNVAPG